MRLFLEPWARHLLIVHGVVAGVLVGLATHQLLWARRYLRGEFARADQEIRFARRTAIAFVATFVLGAALYPTYRVRVRAEHFDAARTVTPSPSSGAAASPTPAAPVRRDLAWAGRLFDIKEHWVALGAAAALALLALSRLAHPRERRDALALYVGLSLLTAATAWTGAVVGLVTTSLRPVGGP